jgi:hypothetical protein
LLSFSLARSLSHASALSSSHFLAAVSLLCCSLALLARAAVVFLSVIAVCVYACMSGVLWCIALFVAWCVYARCLLRGVYMRCVVCIRAAEAAEVPRWPGGVGDFHVHLVWSA